MLVDNKSQDLSVIPVHLTAIPFTHSSVQYTTDIDSTTRLQSITQERDLDEFLSTATLAGTQFTAGALLAILQLDSD